MIKILNKNDIVYIRGIYTVKYKTTSRNSEIVVESNDLFTHNDIYNLLKKKFKKELIVQSIQPTKHILSNKTKGI